MAPGRFDNCIKLLAGEDLIDREPAGDDLPQLRDRPGDGVRSVAGARADVRHRNRQHPGVEGQRSGRGELQVGGHGVDHVMGAELELAAQLRHHRFAALQLALQLDIDRGTHRLDLHTVPRHAGGQAGDVEGDLEAVQ
jgi:hypothetical protein